MTLQRKARLRRGAPFQRTPMKRSGKSPNDFPPAVRAAVERRSGGRCEASTPVCTQRACRHHHIRPRRAKDNTAANDLHVCNPCHLYIHDQPTESYEQGWLIRVN